MRKNDQAPKFYICSVRHRLLFFLLVSLVHVGMSFVVSIFKTVSFV